MKDKRLLPHGAGPIFFNGLLFRNPVLIGALGMYPIAAAAWNVKNAAALSVLFLALSLPSSLLLCLTGMLVPRWFRPGLVLLVSAALYVPAGFLTDLLLSGSVSNLGMAAGLMICNSVVFSRAEEYAPEHVALAVAADSLGCSAGFAVTAFLIAVLRGAWMGGAGLPGGTGFAVGRAADLPFAGFLLLGFLAALIQWINRLRSRRSAERMKRRMP
ncbi:Rnf-Nqr domain containing protein [Caproicibacter sp. BJN0012]|uniref:Rnf-Nqr domain containing protein n=1 Tax=Caproicibacter sp. BJN0012 TaxID=3110227 RepID=UPI002E161B8B|nr:Rnf-Nqr domain containing protein [Caproicibacter sp. BJN0012]